MALHPWEAIEKETGQILALAANVEIRARHPASTDFRPGVYRSAVTPWGTGAVRQTAIAALATAVWLGGTLALGASGRLGFTTKPPTMLVLIAPTIVLAVVLGSSRLGLRLATGSPLAALVGVQAFRFPLELMLHRAYVEGLMPVQMSFSGLNFDILTGLSAIVVTLALVRNPGSLVLVRVWNTAGVVLLTNIVTIALLSAPTPFRFFHNEPAPWVWLPTVFVFAAILGHIVVLRRIRHELSSTVRGRVADPHGAVIAR